MIRQQHTSSREVLVAEAIQEVVSELRQVEVADYIAFIRMEQFGNICDIVDSAAELYFMPGTLRLGHGGEAHVAWDSVPRIVLDMELRPRGVTVYFSLTMSADEAAVEVNYVSFEAAGGDPADNTAFLQAALTEARIRKTVVGSLEPERRRA